MKMKKIVTIILSSIALFGHAQTQVIVDSPEYNQRKLAGTLDQVTEIGRAHV